MKKKIRITVVVCLTLSALLPASVFFARQTQQPNTFRETQISEPCSLVNIRDNEAEITSGLDNNATSGYPGIYLLDTNTFFLFLYLYNASLFQMEPIDL